MLAFKNFHLYPNNSMNPLFYIKNTVHCVIKCTSKKKSFHHTYKTIVIQYCTAFKSTICVTTIIHLLSSHWVVQLSDLRKKELGSDAIDYNWSCSGSVVFMKIGKINYLSALKFRDRMKHVYYLTLQMSQNWMKFIY